MIDRRGEPVSIVLAGIGGMGGVYVRALLDKLETGTFRIAGAVDPYADRCPLAADLSALGVPIFTALEEFYDGREAELAIVSSPIQFHADQTCLALERGSHVLCEKPIAGTVGEARRMMEAERRSGRWVAIGFQWSYSPAVQALKRDIMAGVYGRPRRLKCLYLWPRDRAYYARNDWAGRRRDDAGRWILDSPAQNAMAHDLHNMFYVLGAERETSALPIEVEAELYRAYPIENFDTAAARGRTAEGVDVLFCVSHACALDRGPVFTYAFERGGLVCQSRTSGITGLRPDGTSVHYGVPDAEPMIKLWDSIDGVRTGRRPACGLEAAFSQLLFLNGMQASCPDIADFPAAGVHEEPVPGGGVRLVMDGLDDVLEACCADEILPSELGAAWARPGRRIDLTRDPDMPRMESLS